MCRYVYTLLWAPTSVNLSSRLWPVNAHISVSGFFTWADTMAFPFMENRLSKGFSSGFTELSSYDLLYSYRMSNLTNDQANHRIKDGWQKSHSIGTSLLGLQHWLSAVFRPEVQDCVRARCSLEVSRESDCNNAKAIGKRSWVARAGDDHSSVKEGSLSIISLLL